MMMKKTMFAGMMLIAAVVWAGDAPPAGLKGTILEIKDVESYSYLRLKTKEGETWAAVPKAAFKKGAQVTIEDAMVMTNFESKGLKRTFPTIVFGNVGGAAAAGMAMPAATGAAAPQAGDVQVPKAEGANAHTVAEVLTKSSELKDKPVVIRGKVVKYNTGIMGKNWVHLRDGSGSAADNTNDLIVTTTGTTQVGATVVAKGVVRTGRDFGSGYAYKVLVEDATLQ